MRKSKIILLGQLPPPYVGPSIATEIVLSSRLKDEFELIHLDTSDHRGVYNVGRLDMRNIYLAILNTLQLLFFLVRYSPRVVYLPICQTTTGYMRDVIYIFLSKMFGARIIIHLRGGYFRTFYDSSNLLVKFVIRNSCKLVHKAIVLGESLRYIFEGLVADGNIVVIPNGIDSNYITDGELQKTKNIHVVSRQYPSESALIRMNQNPARILFLSNLALTKGFFDVIKAIPEVTRSDSNVEFIFAGETYESEQVNKQISEYIEENHLSLYVKFAGSVNGQRKKELLLSADIFVLPTYYPYEGQPWVIIEAMAAGLPIIATDQGCIKEMVIHNENGFVVEKQNPKQIAEKISLLIRDNNLRQEMGVRSRERFLEYYTKDKFIQELGKNFEEVMEQQKR